MKKVFQDATPLRSQPFTHRRSNRHRTRLSIHPDPLRHLWRHAPVLRNHRKHGPGRQHIPHNRALFTPFAPFRNEMRDIILSEFGNTAHTYLAILEAIATGKTRRSEIAGPVGLPATSLSKYLRELSTYLTSSNAKYPLLSNPGKQKKVAIKSATPLSHSGCSSTGN